MHVIHDLPRWSGVSREVESPEMSPVADFIVGAEEMLVTLTSSSSYRATCHISSSMPLFS